MELLDFEDGKTKGLAPLADRMRPQTLDDLIGQKHLVGENAILRRMIETDRISSIILFGSPGIGKSSLANIIAKTTKSQYIQLNAVLSNIADIRNSVKKGESNLHLGQRTILFIDEIHRFNKTQQDALLPALENGSIILIGSTTQNPYFYLTNALLSRITLFELRELTESDIVSAINFAIKDKRGLGNYDLNIENSVIEFIAKNALGDIRKALSYLEMAFLSVELDDSDDKPTITIDTVKEVTQKQGLKYDGTGEEHYNIISAFIKSIRGSDSNAAIYWLARMIESGEDPRFIARRLSIIAAEDVGLAEPNALNIVSSMINVIDFIGMPEGIIVLGEVTVYLALCPKSNSTYNAINQALTDVRNGEIYPVPDHLKDAHSASIDRRQNPGYKYAHDYPYHIVKQTYLADDVQKNYYLPGELGEEKIFKQRYEWIKKHFS